MTLTINLDQVLAVQLRRKASARQLSVEESAVRLLGEAVERLEETELDALQSVLDRRLEPTDDRLLAELDRMNRAVAALPYDSRQ
jgi:hypothetical protein